MPDNRINQLMREKYNSLRPRENPPANQDSYAFVRKRSRDKFNQELYEQLSLHEGKKPSVYTDTKGKRTIGIGFNLDEPSNRKKAESLGLNVEDMLSGKKTLSDKEIKLLYNESIKQAANDANAYLPQAGRQPPVVQKILIDMAFNLGLTKLNKFENMKEALLEGDYNKAADEMIDSEWYHQVGNRSKTLVDMMRSVAQ